MTHFYSGLLVQSPLHASKPLGVPLSLCEELKNSCNVTQPTTAQAQYLPLISQGKDVLIRDRPGTGKSFGLTIALACAETLKPTHTHTRVATRAPSKPTHSIYVVPNEELAHQIAGWMRLLLPNTPPYYTNEVFRTSKTVVGTASRILHYIEQGHLAPEQIERMILDEADQALSLPKRYATTRAQALRVAHPKPAQQLLENIMDYQTTKPQLIASSATLNRPMRFWLTERGWMVNPVFVDITHGTTTAPQNENHPTVSHHCLLISDDTIRNFQTNPNEPAEKEAYVPSDRTGSAATRKAPSVASDKVDSLLIENFAILHQVEDVQQGILFVGTSVSSTEIQRSLAKHNIFCKDIREYATHASTTATTINTLWIANEFSARGIDIPNVSHVFILGQPSSLTAYFHMAGRTGRLTPQGFCSGKVISLVMDKGFTESRLRTMYNHLAIDVEHYEHVD
ncbi:P-loop containing nucleoside triphosphate hydrolase protein [Spinellus fusiger]|nr:P-loop containing nucleoside triphosphate hydrolase protein [Spinellus fusiger]